MKMVLLIMCFAVGAYLLGKKEAGPDRKDTQEQLKLPATVSYKSDLTVLFNQDVTKSGVDYGVELLSSDQLRPYYDATNRNINLGFSLVNDTSIGRPVQVFLERKSFITPVLSDYVEETSKGRERRTQKLEFVKAKKQYEQDSIVYFLKRDSTFRSFCRKVDSIISMYQDRLDLTTDIATCFETDKKQLKVFNAPGSQKVVILNSDGKDNRNKWKNIQKLPAKVILVNSGPAIKTPIDKLIDVKLATIENAIQYSLTL